MKIQKYFKTSLQVKLAQAMQLEYKKSFSGYWPENALADDDAITTKSKPMPFVLQIFLHQDTLQVSVLADKPCQGV